MSVDKLQQRIRKQKNATVVDLTISIGQIPPAVLEETGSCFDAYLSFAEALLRGLKDIVPAVRFDFNAFALLGGEGLNALEQISHAARNMGYYVLLNSAEMLSAQMTEHAAATLFSDQCKWYFDGLITTAYIGSDSLRPYIARIRESGKALFVAVRTANKTAPEIQDLLTGSRLVHVAKTDMVNRFAEPTVGKSGYSDIAIMAAATSADSLRVLRSKYKCLFMLLDGYDYPNANAKNCSFAFDNLGHGAAICAGQSIAAAWQECEQVDFVCAATAAAERLKKNLNRYVTIL